MIYLKIPSDPLKRLRLPYQAYVNFSPSFVYRYNSLGVSKLLRKVFSTKNEPVLFVWLTVCTVMTKELFQYKYPFNQDREREQPLIRLYQNTLLNSTSSSNSPMLPLFEVKLKFRILSVYSYLLG